MSTFSGIKFHNDPVRSVGIAIQRNSGILKFQRKNFEILTFFISLVSLGQEKSA